MCIRDRIRAAGCNKRKICCISPVGIVIVFWRLHIGKDRNFGHGILFKQKIQRHIAEILQLFKRRKSFCFLPYILKPFDNSIYHTFNALLDQFILIFKMIIYKA